MYIYLGRAEPAHRFLGETSTTVTSVPLTKVFGVGVTATHPFSAVCRIHLRTGKGGNSVSPLKPSGVWLRDAESARTGRTEIKPPTLR